MRHFFCPLLMVSCLWLCLSTLSQADPTLLTWDGTPATVGTIDNVAGTWTSTGPTTHWYNGGTLANQAWDPTAIAQFGSLNSSIGTTITVNEAITVAGINFLPLASPLTGSGFQFTTTGGGSINLGTGSTISIATNASNSSGNYVRFSLPIVGNNLTVAKADGTLQAFFDLAAVNPNLTGTLTLKSSPGGGGVFAVLRPANITGLSSVIVESGSTLYFSVANATFSTPVTIAGTSPALRVDSNNATFTGQITLSASSRLHSNVNVLTTTVASTITETVGGSKGFTRSSTIAANPAIVTPLTAATLAPTTIFSGTSSYTGATTFGSAATLCTSPISAKAAPTC